MFKSPKKSPKKNDLLDISSRIILDIEYAEKKLAQDLKTYKNAFAELSQTLEQIETLIRKPDSFKSTELNKAFSNVKVGIGKLNKEIESSQKHLHKSELEFEKKLHLPFANGSLSNTSPEALEVIKANIAKIQTTIQANKLALEEMVEAGQSIAERAMALEESVHKTCLPDELAEAAKVNQKLNERMELLCQETAALHLKGHADNADGEKINACVLQLYAAHRKSEKLLEQIQKNLQPLNVAANAAQPSAERKEGLSP